MLMYHLFYHVKNTKNSYYETKVFQFKKNAMAEAVKLNKRANVDLVYIREVDLISLGVEIIKGNEYAKKYEYTIK